MKKLLPIFLCLAMLVFMLSACLNGTGPAENTAGNSGIQAAGSKTILSIAGVETMTSLDRYDGFGLSYDSVGSLWGDTLLATDHMGNYIPNLATEWKWSPDNLTCTFVLRQGVKFQDGTDFTSADVKATFERLVQDEKLANAGKWSAISSVEVPDRYKAVLHLSNVMPNFYAEAAILPIIEAAAYKKDPMNFFFKPVGTGAFQVISFDKATGETTLKRNENWWGWTAQNKSNIDKIIYKIIGEDTARVSALRDGDIDIAEQVPPDDVDTLQKSGLAINKYLQDMHTSIGFRCAPGSVFADANLRKAFSLCIDRKQIVDSILGAGEVATWPCMEGNLGYKSTSGYAYDLEKAKQLVKASGYKGKELDLIVPQRRIPRSDEVVLAIYSMASAAGFNVKIEMLEADAYDQRRMEGKYDIAFGAFAFGSGDTYVELVELVGNDRFNTGYVNEQLRELALSCSKIVDAKQRDAITQKAFQMEYDNFAPYIYLYRTQGIVAKADNIKGEKLWKEGTADYRFVAKN